MKPKTISEIASEQLVEVDSTNFRERRLRFLTAPKRLIQTPWGKKEVYDPTQDPIVRSAYRNYMDTEFPNHSIGSDVLSIAYKDLLEDYKRLGCSGVISNTCEFYNFTGCEGDQPYGTCYNLPPESGIVESCLINNELYHIGEFRQVSEFEKSLAKYFVLQCNKWKKIGD